MSGLEIGFALANGLAALVWVALIAAPGARFTRRLFSGWWVLGALSAYFVAMLAYGVAQSGFAGTFGAVVPPTLSGVLEVFRNPAMTPASWAHYLVADLFVARWIFVREPRPSYRLSLVFLLCMVAAPLGLAAYGLLGSQTRQETREPVHA